MKTKFYDAVLCSDYTKYFHGSNKEAMEAEFPKDQSWVCPFVGEDFMYELLNNPYSFKDGKNLMMVVNECSVAV